MNPQSLFSELHRAGFGITVNMWAEHDDVAVVLWRDGKPVASGEAASLFEALERAQRYALAVQ